MVTICGVGINSRDIIFVVLFLINLVSSVCCSTSNVTRNLYSVPEEDELLYSLRRLPRFLSFKPLDEDLKVDLEFAVPFIKIPVKRAQDAATSMSKSLANVNLSALVLSGLIIILGISVGSALSSAGGGTAWNGFKPYGLQKMTDLLEPLKFSYKDSRGIKTETSLHDIVEGIEGMFQSQDVDVTSCLQKTICFLVKSSYEKVLLGKGSSTEKIIDGISSSSWLLRLMEGTAVKDAVDMGKAKRSCNHKYHFCKWTESEILDFLTKYLQLF